MKTNLAQQQEINNGISLHPSTAKKLERQAMSDKEVSYTKTPNYLVDEDYVARMTGPALKCYVVINRYTEGFSRKNWAIASSFLLEKTGIKKIHTAYDAVKQLEEFGLLSVHREDGRTNKFTITHPCQKMEVVPKKGNAEKGHGGNAEKGHGGNAEKGHTKKESIKENIKESIYVQNAHEQAKQEQVLVEQKLEAERLEEQKAEQEAKANLEAKAKAKKVESDLLLKNFELFWAAYPNKKSKKAAFEKFKRIDFKKTSFESIMISLEKQKQSDDWTKNNGQYVPMPQTWIFNERWADEIQAPVQQQHTDVNAYWADKLQAQEPVVNFVPTLVLGEEFN